MKSGQQLLEANTLTGKRATETPMINVTEQREPKNGKRPQMICTTVADRDGTYSDVGSPTT